MRQRGDGSFKRGAGLLLLSIAAASCTAILGIDKDYHKPDGGASGGATTGDGGSGGGGGSDVSQGSGGGDNPACGTAPVCEEIPAGWALVATKDASPNEPPGKCADGSTGTLYFTGPAGPPTCGPCTCTVDPSARCTAPEITCYINDNNCIGPESFKRQSTQNQCIDVNNLPTGVHSDGSCRITNPAALSVPGCSSQGGMVLTPDQWSGAKLLCPAGAVQGSCAEGQLCVPNSPGPDGSLCIARPGSDACPPSFPKSIDAFTGGADSRICACHCTLGCAGGSYVVHDANNCQGLGDPDVNITSTSCTRAANIFDNGQASLQASVAAPVVETCTGDAGGQVTGTGPERICCK